MEAEKISRVTSRRLSADDDIDSVMVYVAGGCDKLIIVSSSRLSTAIA
jgi:hypothetical protein